MRDVAYGQVPKGLRAQLHLGFTDWVKNLPSKADEFVEIVAWHLEQACLLAREVTRSPIEPPVREAAVMLEEAAGRAERRESLREAHRYYTRALDLLGDEFLDLRAELRVRRAGRMAMMLGELKEASEELEDVVSTASCISSGTTSDARRSCSFSATSTSARDASRRRTTGSPLAVELGGLDRQPAPARQRGLCPRNVRWGLRGRA